MNKPAPCGTPGAARHPAERGRSHLGRVGVLTSTLWRWVAGLGLVLAGGCSALLPQAPPLPATYALDGARGERRDAAPRPSSAASAAPTLLVQPPRAGPGFDSRRMVYLREPYRLEHFAHSEWADTPAHMLAPLIVAAVESTGSFRAVVPAASGVAANLRLDTEIVRLQQDFGDRPSRVRFTLRAYVLDGATRRVIAWREFDHTAAAASDDPQGGVVAANLAVQVVLGRLAVFCTEAAALAPPATSR